MKRLLTILVALLIFSIAVPAHCAAEDSGITLSFTLIHRCALGSPQKPPYLGDFWVRIQSVEFGTEWDVRLTPEPSVYEYVFTGTLNDVDTYAPFTVRFFRKTDPIEWVSDSSGPHFAGSVIGQTYGVACPYRVLFPVFRGGGLTTEDESVDE